MTQYFEDVSTEMPPQAKILEDHPNKNKTATIGQGKRQVSGKIVQVGLIGNTLWYKVQFLKVVMFYREDIVTIT